MTWYEQWFDRDEYALVYRNRNGEEAEQLIQTLLGLIRISERSRILDVGCGRGRHAIAFARRGHRVTGLDLSEQSLKVARKLASEERLKISFVHGDMRETRFRKQFDLVVNLFTAFGYFEAPSDHQRALDAMAAALVPGGLLVQDFLNAPRVRANLVPEEHRQVDDADIHIRRWIEEDRIKKEIRIRRGQESHSFVESVALLERADLERLHAGAGLIAETVRGDYDGSPFGPDSPRLILVSRKPEIE